MASSSMAGEQERSKSMAGEQERGKTTPRIKSGNCSVLLSNSSTSNSNNPSTGSAAASNDIYDKQMAWRLHGQRKVRLLARKCTCAASLVCTVGGHTCRVLIVMVVNACADPEQGPRAHESRGAGVHVHPQGLYVRCRSPITRCRCAVTFNRSHTVSLADQPVQAESAAGLTASRQ